LPQYLQDPGNNGGSRYYGDLDYDDIQDLWVLKGLPQMVEMAKRLFPASKSKEPGIATFPNSPRIIGDLNWFTIRYPLKINDSDRWKNILKKSQAHYQKQQTMLTKIQKETPGVNFHGELRDFQKEGLAFMLHNRRSLLADEVGLGKTIMALAWLTRIEAKPPYLIVMPPHLLRQWRSEIRRFLGDITIHEIHGLKPYPLPRAAIYITHYLILRGWKQALQEYQFNACIFDEIQELRHSESEKYSVASMLSSNISNVIGLSGSPFYNFGGELWNILNILEYHCLGDYGSFSREWCGDGYGGDKITDPRLFGSYLREQGLMLRRLKEDVLSELPPKFRIIQEIDTDHGIYDSLIGPAVNIAKELLDTKQDNFERGRKIMAAIDQTRRVTGIAKAGFVADFIRTLLEAGEPSVGFAHHHAVMDILMKELQEFNPVMISGRQNREAKDLAQQLFMKGETNLIFVSLRSATGLNLQRGRCAVFAELDWSPAVHCIDEHTEILTKDGFRGVDDVSVGDMVAGFDITDESICFIPVLNKVDRLAESDETMYRVNTKKIDLAVTGNHRLVYRTMRRTNNGNGRSQWRISTAEELAGVKRRYIPTCGNEYARGVDLSDDELKLIGLYLSDGHLTNRSLTIYQSAHQPWNKDIVKILNGAGVSWNLYVRKKKGCTDMNWYTIPIGKQPRWTKNEVKILNTLHSRGISNKEIARRINRTALSVYLKRHKTEKGQNTIPGNEKPRKGWKTLGPYLDKNLSPLLQDMTTHQFDCFIYGLWLGDGAKTDYKVTRIDMTNKILMEQLQSLCVRRGKTAILSKRNQKNTTYKANKPMYTLRISETNEAYLQDGKTHESRLRPDDHSATGMRVWCVTNKLGTIVVRRNGKVAVVGNSQCEGRLHRIGVRDSVMCYYLVCDRGTDQAMLETLGLKKSQFVGIMGDPMETQKDELEAQVEIKKHMESVIDVLQQGGKPRKKPSGDVLELIKKTEPRLLEKKLRSDLSVPELRNAWNEEKYPED